jgi:light-regulated signal transduction histidine kinase (bacteriophytochrome)
MRNHLQNELAQSALPFVCQPIALHKLVDKVQTGLLPNAIDKNSFIINDVKEDLVVMADEDILAFVIGALISNAICSTSNSCIRVETVSRERQIQIIVRNNGKFDYSPGMHSLVTMTGAARKLGGIISLQSEPRGGFAVVLSMAAAA